MSVNHRNAHADTSMYAHGCHPPTAPNGPSSIESYNFDHPRTSPTNQGSVRRSSMGNASSENWISCRTWFLRKRGCSFMRWSKM
jgi:hypothetical protein